jgi:hypothetical protein
MDLRRAWQLCAASRSLRFVIPMSILLLISLAWNARNYRLDQERRAQAKAAERASQAVAALAREHAERAEFRRRGADARSDTRVQQLYDEINELTRLSERVLSPIPATRTTPATTSGQDKSVLVP